MTLGGYSWRGGTREYPHRQDDDRDQSEEPPAEYWEQRGRQQETDEYTAGSDGEIVRIPTLDAEAVDAVESFRRTLVRLKHSLILTTRAITTVSDELS